jgi:hypothetical protein
MFFSSRNLSAAVLLTSAALLAVSPLHAASKTKPATTAKAHSVSNSKATSSKTFSSKTSSKPTSKTVSLKSAASASRHSQKSSLKAVAVAAKPKSRGQQAIDSGRTAEIQEALIREHYLDGEPTGQWDQATREALTRFQGDHNWQTKIVPDARALIKLGLGPSRQNLLNPESAAMAPAYMPVAERSVSGGSN